MTGPRRQAREAALQVLYLWEVGRTEPGVAIQAFFAEHEPDAGAPVVDFTRTLVSGTVEHLAEIDQLIAAHSANWRIERIAIVDRLILRMAIWELQHDHEMPPAVVLNEAVELARRFSTDDSVRFVNGVLDAIRKALAPAS